MPIPSTGPITLVDVQNEFGGSNPIGLNEYYAGGANVPSGTTGNLGAIPSSGLISLDHFRGSSKVNLINIVLPFLNSIKADYPGRTNAGTSSDPIIVGPNLYPGTNFNGGIFNEPTDPSVPGQLVFGSQQTWSQSNYFDDTGGQSPFWYVMLNNENVLLRDSTHTGPPNKSQSRNSNNFVITAQSSSISLKVQQTFSGGSADGDIPFLSLQSLGGEPIVGRYGDGMRIKYNLQANFNTGFSIYHFVVYMRNENVFDSGGFSRRRRGIFVLLGNQSTMNYYDPGGTVFPLEVPWNWRFHNSAYYPGFNFKFINFAWYNARKAASAPLIPTMTDTSGQSYTYEYHLDDLISKATPEYARSDTEILGVELAVEQTRVNAMGAFTGQYHFTEAVISSLQAFRISIQGFPLYGPTAEFYASATYINVADTVTFRNLSYNRASSGDWYINNVYQSSARNFSYQFNVAPGTYQVKLVVSNTSGQTDQKIINVTVVYSPSVRIFNSSQNWTVPSGASWWVMFAISAGGRGGAANDGVANGDPQGAGGGGGGGGIWYVDSSGYGNFSSPGSQVIGITIGQFAGAGGRGNSTTVTGFSQTFVAEGGYGGANGYSTGGAGGTAGPFNQIYGGYIGAQPEGLDSGGGGGGAGGHAPSDGSPGSAGQLGGIGLTFTIGGQTFTKGAGGIGGISLFNESAGSNNSGDGGRGAGSSSIDNNTVVNGAYGGSGVVIIYA